MSESLTFRVGNRRMPQTQKEHASDREIRSFGARLVARRALAACATLVALGSVYQAASREFVSQNPVCVTTEPAASSWNSGAEAAGRLRDAGVMIDYLPDVADLVTTERGGQVICGKTFSGLPLLTGMRAELEHVFTTDVYAK